MALAFAGLAAVAIQSKTSRETADFTFYYAAAGLIREGNPGSVYQQPALAAAITRAASTSAVDRRLPYNLPLAAVLPILPLTALPLDLAFRAWQVISLAVLGLTLFLLLRAYPLGRVGLPTATLALFASIPLWAVLTEGQLSALPVLGGACVLATLRTGGVWLACAGGMLLAVKPHFLPVYLIVLLAARRWRLLAAASVGAAVMLLSPMAAGGVGGLLAMTGNALSTNQLVPIRLTESWSGILAVALPSNAAAIASLVVYLGTLMVLAALAWLRPGPAPAFAALASWLAMLASPHVLPHDLLLLGPTTWLAVYLFRERGLGVPGVALLVVDLSLLVDLRGVGMVLGPVAMTAAAAWAVWRFRRQDARRPAQRPMAAA